MQVELSRWRKRRRRVVVVVVVVGLVGVFTANMH